MTILYTNNDYKLHQDDWIILRDLYKGDRKELLKSSYLWPHALESKENDADASSLRRIRENRTRYKNLMEVSTSLWCSYAFPGEPTYDDKAAELLKDVKQNIDGRGTSMFMFIKDKVFPQLIIYGRPIILVDNVSSVASSRKQEQITGARAFMEVLDPLCVKDYQVEQSDIKRIGKLNFLRYEYELEKPRQRATNKPASDCMSDELALVDSKYNIFRYKKERDAQGLYLSSDDSWALTEQVTLDNSELPIAVIWGESWLNDAKEEALRFYNLRSDYDSVLHNQAYQKLFAFGANLTNDDERKAMAEYVISVIQNPEGSVQAIEPPDLSSLERALSDSANSFFQVAMNMTRQLASDSKVGQSAESYSAEKDNTYSLVESTLNDIETLMNEAIKHYAFFTTGDPNFDGKLSLNKDIKEENYQEFLDTVSMFKEEIRKLPTVHKEVVKRAIEKLDLPDDKLEEMTQEIDDAQFDSIASGTNLAANRSAILDNVLGTGANAGSAIAA